MSQIICASEASDNTSLSILERHESKRFMAAHGHNRLRECSPALLEHGYCPVPIGTSKIPAVHTGSLLTHDIEYLQQTGRYFEAVHQVGLPRFRPAKNWQRITPASFTDRDDPLYFDIAVALDADVQGVGVMLGHKGLLGLDLDSDAPEARRIFDEETAALDGVVVRKRGAHGVTQFVRVAMGDAAALQSRALNDASGQRVLDILGVGRQSVLPPSVHPSGQKYEWVDDDRLMNTDLADLPLVTGEWIDSLIAKLGVVLPGAAVVVGDGGGYAAARAAETSQAIHQAEAWIFDLGIYGLTPKRDGGWQGVAHWRESGTGARLERRKPNLHIDQNGIKDFGTGERYRPFQLVAAALGLSDGEARLWLAERVTIADREQPQPGIERLIVDGLRHSHEREWLVSLGADEELVGHWERRELGTAEVVMALRECDRESAVEWLLENFSPVKDMPACSVRIGPNWILDIPGGGVGVPVLRRYVEPVEDVVEEPVEEPVVDGDNDAVLKTTVLVREAVMDIAEVSKKTKGAKRKAAVAARTRVVDFNSDASDFRGRINDKIVEIEHAEHAVRVVEGNLTGDDRVDDHALSDARDVLRGKKDDLRRLIKKHADTLDEARQARRGLISVKPEVRILSVYQGQGKTTSWIKSALPDLLADGQKVLCLASSLDLVREQAADFREVVGDNFNSAIIYGMDAHHPSTEESKGRPMCARHKEAKAISDAGLNASELCTNEGRVCEFAHACPIYQARLQAASADVVFAASANAFVNSAGLRDFYPGTIFIDESFTGFGRADPVEVSISDLLAFGDPAAPADLDEDADEVEQARHARRMKRHARRVELFSQARGLLTDLVKHQESRGDDYKECKDDRGRRISPLQIPIGDVIEDGIGKLKRLEELFRMLRWVGGFQLKTRARGLVSPTMSREQIEGVIATGAGKEAKLARARLALASEGIRSCRMVLTINERVHVVDDTTLRLMPTSPINDRYLKPGPDMVEHIVVANGTPEARHLIEQAFTYHLRKRSVGPHIVEEIECPRAGPARTFSACHYKNHPLKSAKKMGRYGKQNATTKNLGAHNRRDSAAFIMQQIEQHADGDPRQCVVIASKQTRRFLKDVLPEGVSFLERQKAIGVNAFSDFRLLIYVDADSPPHAVREKLMREIGQWVGPEDYEKGSDGIWRLKEPKWQEHAEQIKRSLAQQCVERLRTRWVKKGGIKQHAIIISEVDGILPAEEITVADWYEEARDETRTLERSSCLKNELSRMLCNGIFTQNQRTMAGYWGKDYSDEALRELGTLLDQDSAELVCSNSIAPQRSLKSALYRHHGAKSWSTAYGYGDIKSLISKASDGAVEFKEEADQAQIELVTPSELGTGELGTPIFTNPTPAFAADSTRWLSVEAAKKDLQRNPPVCPDGWVEVTVIFEGRGQRPGAVYMPAAVGKIEITNMVERATGWKVKAMT